MPVLPAHVRRALEQLARLEPGDLTATGPVVLGTESARILLAALDDAGILRRVRELLAAGTAPQTVAALLAAPADETTGIVPRP